MSVSLPPKQQTMEEAKPLVWDCGSSLYDSFELKSFERQLHSAIGSTRTLSMPHLPDYAAHRQGPPPKPTSKKPSRFSRPFQKLLRSVFGPKQNPSPWFNVRGSRDGFYVAYERSGSLRTIPEVPETGVEFSGGSSPEFKPPVKRSASDRFTATSIGISCA